MRYLPAVVVDVVLIMIFAAIGRSSHGESPAGFLLTAWPFVVAALVGHLLAGALPGRPRRPWSVAWGLVVWVVTVTGGMGLRVLSGQTAEVPFLIVATLVLAAFLVGWRSITALLRRRRAGGRSAEVFVDGDGSEPDADQESESPADPTSEPLADHRTSDRSGDHTR